MMKSEFNRIISRWLIQSFWNKIIFYCQASDIYVIGFVNKVHQSILIYRLNTLLETLPFIFYINILNNAT